MKSVKNIHEKKSSNSKKAHKKNTPVISRKRLLIVVALLTLITAMSLIPVSYVKTEYSSIGYETEYKDENAIELGTENVAQNGIEGSKFTDYKYKQNLFQYLFLKDSVSKTELKSGVSKEATKRIVLKGTRKWQYMMCSNGSYRYFTDEQFKSKFTGFTNSSPDYCEQNNQGKKIGLADTAKGTTSSNRPSYVPANCTLIDIPYKTVYKDASWLYVGETQNGFGGINGYKNICTNSSLNYTINPVDQTVWLGTKQATSTYFPPSTTQTPSPDYAAKYKCDADYSYAKAQLSINGAGSSSAMDYVNQLYYDCLRRAGFRQ